MALNEGDCDALLRELSEHLDQIQDGSLRDAFLTLIVDSDLSAGEKLWLFLDFFQSHALVNSAAGIKANLDIVNRRTRSKIQDVEVPYSIGQVSDQGSAFQSLTQIAPVFTRDQFLDLAGLREIMIDIETVNFKYKGPDIEGPDYDGPRGPREPRL